MWIDRFDCLPLQPRAGADPDDSSDGSQSQSSVPASLPPETESEGTSPSRPSSPIQEEDVAAAVTSNLEARLDMPASSLSVPSLPKRKHVCGDMSVMLEAGTQLSEGVKRSRTSHGVGTDRRVHPADEYLKDLD